MVSLYQSLIESYFKVVDSHDWDALRQIYHQDIIYQRPGYPDITGIEPLIEFYRVDRVLGEGQHLVEHIIIQGDLGSCWGWYHGFKKTGEPVHERFADVFSFADDKIKTRTTFFYKPAV